MRRGVAPRFLGARPIDAPLITGEKVAVPADSVTPDAPPVAPANVHYIDKFAPVDAVDRVVLEPATIEDVDALWDWVRADPEGSAAFLGGQHIGNSRDLFTFIGKVAEMERNGHAKFFSIRDAEALLGFIMLNPIHRQVGHAPVGTVHVYLGVESRGRLKAILPRLIEESSRVAPGVNLCVITSRPEWASMLEDAGFASHTVLTRPASVTGDAHG